MKVDAREEIARQTLEKVVRQTDQVSTIIDDLLNVMRLRQGDLVLRRERVDLTALAWENVEKINQLAEPGRVRLSSDGPVVVMGDPGLIGRVLVRIVENALLYSPAGTPVDVETKREGARGIISVTDRGPGIPPERQRHVFEPFYESVPAGAPGYVGIVSLGLYLSKQLLDAVGGQIELRSTPGQGTTFLFSLPLTTARFPPH
jgi:signal transduction histidine kinase